MKRFLTILLALTTALGIAGCGKDEGGETAALTESASSGSQESAAPESEEQPSEVKITDGRFYLDINNGMDCYVHFYEDGTYYAKYFDGSMMEAGTWELADKELDYMTPGPDNDVTQEADNGTATAKQVVIFTPYTTGIPVEVAYDGDALCDMSLGGMANHRTLTHEPDYAYNPDVDETAIQLFVFYANNDIGANMILNHNKTFEDLTGDAYNDGTWEMAGAGVYDMTYSDGSSATLTVAEDGKSAVLKKDGKETELRDDYREPSEELALFMSLRAEDVSVPELPMGVNVRLDGYSDGTCQVIIEVTQMSAELVADTGTYEVSEAAKPTFHFETLGDIEGTPDYAAAGEDGLPFTVHLAGTTNPEFNGDVSPMTLDTDVTGIYNPSVTE